MVPNRNPDNCFAEAQERATLTPTMVLGLNNLSAADAFYRFASRITYVAV
ncbi:hypothetical protein [Microcoleus sp. F4-D5]